MPFAATSSARTVAPKFGANPERSVQVAVLMATRPLAAVPLTALKYPPAYSVDLSGESANARTVAVPLLRVKESEQPVGAPVAALNAAKLTAGVVLLPAGAPAGRTLAKVPPAYTTPFASASAQTIPLV